MRNNPSKSKLRNFGLLIGIGFPLFIGLIMSTLMGHDFRIWTLFVSIPFLILAFISPRLLYYPYQMWMAFGHTLGWVNSKIILGLVFFLILIPISSIMKIFGYDPLSIKNSSSFSYRKSRKHNNIDLNKIF